MGAPNLIQVTLPNAEDGARRVQTLLEAHMAVASAKDLRQFLVHLLAALGGLVAICLRFPHAASEEARGVLLQVWGGLFLCTTLTAIVEWILGQRETRLLARHESTTERLCASDD